MAIDLPSRSNVSRTSTLSNATPSGLGNSSAEKKTRRLSFIDFLSLQPKVAIKGAVLHGLGKMFRFEVFSAFEIGHRPCNFQNAIVAARREAKFRDCVFHNFFAFCRKHAVLVNQSWTHLRVRVDVLVEE